MKMKIRYISLLMVIISLMISTNLYAREGRSGLSTHGDNSELSVIADSLLIDQSSHNQLDNRINTLDTLPVASVMFEKDTASASALPADAHKEKKANKKRDKREAKLSNVSQQSSPIADASEIQSVPQTAPKRLEPFDSIPAPTSNTKVDLELPMISTHTPNQRSGQLLSGGDSTMLSAPQKAEKKHFLPTRRRMDREINRIPYIFKREVAIGLTVSYGAINSDDTDYLLIFDNLNFKGSMFTINPSFMFFLKNNLGIGARFGYSNTKGDIGNATLNLGSANDMNIDLSDIHLDNQAASFGLFMRSYAAIDNKGHFGLFAELEASYKTGKSLFSYNSNDQIKKTHSNTQQFKFSFNPGCSVFIFPNVCSTISFGLGGLQYTKVTQSDGEGNIIGSRETAKMLFRLNLANIRIGVNFFL